MTSANLNARWTVAKLDVHTRAELKVTPCRDEAEARYLFDVACMDAKLYGGRFELRRPDGRYVSEFAVTLPEEKP